MKGKVAVVVVLRVMSLQAGANYCIRILIVALALTPEEINYQAASFLHLLSKATKSAGIVLENLVILCRGNAAS